VGASRALVLLAALCGSSEGRWDLSNLSYAKFLERGALSCDEGDCDTLCHSICLTEKESTAMAKLRYCERIHTHFPVMFAGEAYVGEGTVLNVSVPGCAVHSRKREDILKSVEF
jgi:hypothetical protein